MLNRDAHLSVHLGERHGRVFTCLVIAAIVHFAESTLHTSKVNKFWRLFWSLLVRDALRDPVR